MKLRSTLANWVAKADAVQDRGRRRWQRLSPFDRRLMIVPYMGFGTREQLQLSGRVLRHTEHAEADEAHSGWQNFSEFWKRMESDEVPGARLRACLGAVTLEVLADNEGHFSGALPLPAPLAADGWHAVSLELLDPPPRSGQAVAATAQVLVPPGSARYGVISDIDDTVLWSNVGNKLRMLSMLARSNARTRKPFKGVAAFYQALQRGAAGDEDNPVFYVSSSPWNLYTPLVQFLSLQGLPAGPLMLKDFGDHLLFSSGEHHGHKLACIERVLATYPTLPFVLIGDSGEQDPEIYRQVVHDHPGRVRVIYIRSVNPDPARIDAIDRLIREVRVTGVQLVLAPDSEFAATHAAAEGLIATSALEAVRADKREEEALSAPSP